MYYFLKGINMSFYKKLSIVCCLIISMGVVHADVKEDASGVVREFQNELLNVMQQGDALDFTQRFERLKPVVTKSHDLVKMTRIVMSKQWKSFTKAQKKLLIKKISDLSVTSYAHYFTNYSGESFNIDSVKQVSPTQIYVHTTLVLPEENDVSMDYLLKKKGKNWHIVNIITNGISDLALKRSEYVAVLKKSGLDALLAQLDVKIAKFSK